MINAIWFLQTKNGLARFDYLLFLLILYFCLIQRVEIKITFANQFAGILYPYSYGICSVGPGQAALGVLEVIWSGILSINVSRIYCCRVNSVERTCTRCTSSAPAKRWKFPRAALRTRPPHAAPPQTKQTPTVPPENTTLQPHRYTAALRPQTFRNQLAGGETLSSASNATRLSSS